MKARRGESRARARFNGRRERQEAGYNIPAARAARDPPMDLGNPLHTSPIRAVSTESGLGSRNAGVRARTTESSYEENSGGRL